MGGDDAHGWYLQGVGVQAMLLLGSWLLSLRLEVRSPNSSSVSMRVSGQHTGPKPRPPSPSHTHTGAVVLPPLGFPSTEGELSKRINY